MQYATCHRVQALFISATIPTRCRQCAALCRRSPRPYHRTCALHMPKAETRASPVRPGGGSALLRQEYGRKARAATAHRHLARAISIARAGDGSCTAVTPPACGRAPAMASTMQLEFTQAMTDFKTMFPDMDDDVIEAVLRANQGAVDATIDQLLAMTTDYQNERLRHEIERVESGSPPRRTPRPRATAAPGPDADTVALVNPNDDSIPLSVRRNWVPRMLGPLPPMFLRIPPGADARVDLSLDMDDERIAAFLQNEEFMAELRWNQEFMAALDSEQGHAKAKGHDDEAAFKERLKNMVSRKKFAQLSRMFSRQGARGPPKAPPDSLLLQEEHSDDDDRPRRSRTPNK
ncbi:CUE domain-containing protein 1 [Eumeta japonica]|uniref:CUE domain-containing protein 1 n=1 Tax=Eumeta variegata TaxID=151549 RepID=A0A4C1ZDW8_EUMVA|nr:CUE domain-containing protein 1 [Eumeta japonica]